MRIFCYKHSLTEERSRIIDFVRDLKNQTNKLISDCERTKWDDKNYSAFVSATNKILSEINAGISRLFRSQTDVYVIDELLSALYEYEQLKAAFASV